MIDVPKNYNRLHDRTPPLSGMVFVIRGLGLDTARLPNLKSLYAPITEI